jgi:hypothetical protein
VILKNFDAALQKDPTAIGNIFRLAEESGEFVDRTDAKQVGMPFAVPEKVTMGNFWRSLAESLKPSDPGRITFDHFTDICERLKPSPGQNAMDRALVLFASAVTLGVTRYPQAGSDSAAPALATEPVV